MAFCKWISAFVLLSSATVFAQKTPGSPAQDPRITELITQLEAVRSPRQTAISPDGQWIAWTVSSKEGGSEVDFAPLSNPEAAHRITACAGGQKGSENDIA